MRRKGEGVALWMEIVRKRSDVRVQSDGCGFYFWGAKEEECMRNSRILPAEAFPPLMPAAILSCYRDKETKTTPGYMLIYLLYLGYLILAFSTTSSFSCLCVSSGSYNGARPVLGE